jgi:alkylation response protein AidB-like acyl-CoA dehydrogenase
VSIDPDQTAAVFRAEVRDWLAAHVPAGPLPSVDTAEGFARHREWERELAAARLAVVSWPAGYGGRGASLLHWLIFEEEYARSFPPGAASPSTAPWSCRPSPPTGPARELPRG